MRTAPGKSMMAIVLLLALLAALLAGCGRSGAAERGSGAPSSPITVEVSFPDGAPSLSREARLIAEVNPRALAARDIRVELNLPDGLALVSGNLSWTGDVPLGQKVAVIQAVVRAVKVGNWTIQTTHYIDPKKHGGFGTPDGARNPTYVMVSEDSAKWGRTPPWYKEGRVEPRPVPSDPSVPVTPTPTLPGPIPVVPDKAPSSPLSVTLSIARPPRVGEPVDLSVVVSSHRYDAPNTTAHVKLPKGISLLGGQLDWQGDLKANVPQSFSARIVFSEPGKYAVEGVVKHVPANAKQGSWGGIDVIHLTVGADHSEMGWPRPERSENERDLPQPPAVPVR